MVRQRWMEGSGVVLDLLVLAVIGCGQESALSEKQAATVKAIEMLGGKVKRDAQRPGKPIVGVSFFATEVTDAGLKEMKELSSLQSLSLSATKVTDAGLKELKKLKSLQSLDLAPPGSQMRGLRN